MLRLVRSQSTLAIASASLAVGVLGSLLMVVAYTTYSGPAAAPTSRDLVTAALWLGFVQLLGLALAVGATVWRLVVTRERDDLWEVMVAGGAMLILVIAGLVIAVSIGSAGGNIVLAVGYAVWAVLLVAKAARRSLLEHDDPQERRQAPYWLLAGSGLLVWAAAAGVPDPSLDDVALAVTKGALATVGSVAVVAAVSLAHGDGFLRFRRFRLLAVAVWLVVGSALASLVVGAVVFGSPSFDALRVGFPIPWLIQGVGSGLFAAVAWGQVYEIRGGPSYPGGHGHGHGRGHGPGDVVRASGAGPVSPPPAGWYFSPEHGGERWWDGEKWTTFQRSGPIPPAPEGGPPTSPE